MTKKDVFDILKKLSKPYSLIQGHVKVVEHEGLFITTDFSNTDYWALCGHDREELIVQCFREDTSFAVDKAGVYSFEALIGYYEAQRGEYDRIEIPEYCCIEHMELSYDEEMNKAEAIEEWLEGDKFTTPETDDLVFTVSKVHENDVEARDGRSRSGYTIFAKHYITKV